MNKKKIISLILTVGVISGISSYIVKHNNVFAASPKQDIKVMSYKASAKANENGYQIDKYENVQSVAWLNDNNVLTLTKKGDFKNPDASIPMFYCSIYNLSTKSSKDFKDVNISDFLGVSPDKKYVLYSEPRVIPKVGSDEWQKALDLGDLLHKNVKLLNLSSGEITTINTEKINSDAEFIWVGKNKILSNYFEKWSIIDTSGKVHASGNYSGGKDFSAWVVGTDDIKDSGDNLEGKFLCKQYEHGKEGIKLISIDVKSAAVNAITPTENSLYVDKKGKTIIMDNCTNGKKSDDGLYHNRTWSTLIMNDSGKAMHNIKFAEGRGASNLSCNSQCILSPDGSKAAYIETNNLILHGKNSNDASLKIIDTKTGTVKEIVKLSNLKDKNTENEYRIIKDKNGNKDTDGNVKEQRIPIYPAISNMYWDSNGTCLSFTYGRCDSINNKNNASINTYIVSFDN